MQILLDTHSFLWFVSGHPRCSVRARELIADRTNQAHISIASLWEISIKLSLGKLALSISLDELMTKHLKANDIDVLSIALADLEIVAQLPFHHRDPFDRLLVAQSLTQRIPLISSDHHLNLYGVQRLW